MRRFICILLFFALLSFTSKENASSNSIVKVNREVKEPIAPIKKIDENFTQVALALDTLFTDLQLTRNFSGAILVAKDGKILYDTVIGYSNLKLRIPFPEDPVFQLASVSKQFTAYGILLLQKKGLIDLNNQVSDYIVGFPYTGVTVKMLLTHMSGLPNYIYFWEQSKLNTSNFISAQDVVDAMLTYKPAPYLKPNEKYNYSNTNYVILAYLIEKLSHKTYANFMASEVFGPLGMKKSYVYQPGIMYYNCVSGHESAKKIAKNDCYDGVLGDKGILSTATDLLLWDKALYGNNLLSAEELAVAFTNQNSKKTKSKKAAYGYGWRIGRDAFGNKTVWHGGWWHGFNTYIGRREVNKTCVIILSNISNKSFFSSKEKVWDIIDRGIAAGFKNLAMEIEN